MASCSLPARLDNSSCSNFTFTPKEIRVAVAPAEKIKCTFDAERRGQMQQSARGGPARSPAVTAPQSESVPMFGSNQPPERGPLPRLSSQSPQQHAEGQELLLRPRPDQREPDVSLLISADWSQIGCGWGVLILAVPGARSQTVSHPDSHLRPFHTSQQLHRRSAEMGASLITLIRAKLRVQTDCARAFLTPFKVHLN